MSSCIDECLDKIHDCDQICINVPGTWECACNFGYKLARDHLTCIDIDECALPNNCTDATKCVNTIGSYYCKLKDCPIGYEMSSTNECIDKNECDEGTAKRCSHICVNTVGSYICNCPTGMELASDQLTCIDINECAIDNGGCEQKCVNLDGSSYCKCDENGFILASDQKHCISSNPCSIKNGDCAHVCEPINGIAQCFCYKGFELSTSDNKRFELTSYLIYGDAQVQANYSNDMKSNFFSADFTK